MTAASLFGQSTFPATTCRLRGVRQCAARPSTRLRHEVGGCSWADIAAAGRELAESSGSPERALEPFYDACVFWYSFHALLMAWNRSRLPVSRSGWWSLASSL